MNHDEIDRLLSRGVEIVPSPGFAAAVVEAVQREAAVPAPLPFPWMRAAVGFSASVIAACVAMVLGVSLVPAGNWLDGGVHGESADVFAWLAFIAVVGAAATLPVLNVRSGKSVDLCLGHPRVP